MNVTESFKEKRFRVISADARIRVSRQEIHAFISNGSAYRLIPQGEEVRVREVMVSDTGAEARRIFALAETLDGTELGWTSTRNFSGEFRNETLGAIETAAGAGRFSPTAAWSGGSYQGQVELVRIVNTDLKVRHLCKSTIGQYMEMVAAAESEGIKITLNSGFRSYPEQKYLWEGYQRNLPDFNLAAKPGYSNHQNGIAFDLDVAGGPGNPTYDWLCRAAPTFGFLRTVNKEFWHWEHDPETAVQLASTGAFKLDRVLV